MEKLIPLVSNTMELTIKASVYMFATVETRLVAYHREFFQDRAGHNLQCRKELCQVHEPGHSQLERLGSGIEKDRKYIQTGHCFRHCTDSRTEAQGEL